MRKRLVFWGKNEKGEKVLLGLMLRDEENVIEVSIFPAAEISEEFAEQFHQNWRKGEDVLFPENHLRHEIPLRVSETILPEGYKVDREDILKRAQTEWHFIVLSGKLYRAYQDELEDLKDQVSKLTKFDSAVWEDLKGFWSKVQEQAREKNLFREHAGAIKETTNELFGELKALRKKVDREFHAASQEHVKSFKEAFANIDNKINEGLSLNPIFQELKDLQNKFRDTKFTGSHRNQIWKELDGLFKKVKAKKYGDQGPDNDPSSRLTKRLEGLHGAISRMERSIERDNKEIAFQTKRVDQADGSLESQLRGAKIGMIEQRLESKQEKLKDMLQTRTRLEKQMQKLERQKQAAKEKEKINEAKEELKAKIADEIKEAEQEREGSESIRHAVEAIQEASEPVIEGVEEGLEDVVDTVKAVATVLESRFSGFLSDVADAIKSMTEEE
ncbi:MAG: hypothetical protein KTR24_12565 [Saprospiraceae bacterium]|nr:hypothetical protein [Saprospiraceae bacterium]